MTKTKITETPELENIEPPTLEELLATAVQDATSGESAELLADEFFNEFVNKGRDEVPQVLMLLDMPNETIITALVDMQLQAIEVFKQNAPMYLNNLRNTVTRRLGELANSTASN
jgi:hypothetical protein